ncbi:MAG TPA: DNA-binding domain-containing protein [Candidatus Acidoferrum sp.]|nr:DNA-binding domain-containing protein [Candidatus Acidoferrum sp.]
MKKKRPKLSRQTTTEYHALQRLMALTVMRPLGRDDSMQRKWIDGRPASEIAGLFIKPNDRLTSFERLEIYNRQYWFRIRQCFYEDYPGLRAILGTTRFERLADAYLERYPSQSFTLRNLGSRLVTFLEAGPRGISPHKRLALDMARLEWAHIEAFDNEARPPLKTDGLFGPGAAKIRLQLQPYLTLLKLEYELDDFLIGLKKSSGLRSEASHAMEQGHRYRKARLRHGLKRKTNFLAVHRQQDLVYYKKLEAGEFRILSALQKGATLEKACMELAGLKAPVNPGEMIQKWFSSWAALGWFCDLETSRGKPLAAPAN